MATSKYPTMVEVEAADHLQLAFWQRFLPSPGASEIGKRDFEATMAAEGAVLDRICERLREAGGITPQISKTIGWGA